ncbi:MAG TPA: FHA domain-containing protein [Gemmataceae bacterium]|nr:FHA domain-containing protein [Gemmataceae bacterium]
MKLSLVVLTPGPNQGKLLEIKLSQFVVGRDPQCHLRPASAMISKRHCAVLQREGKAFVRDFDSTNGTFVNNEPVKGEIELHQGDQLKMGPLLFEVRIEGSAPVNRPTPPPPTKPLTKTVAADKSKTPIPVSAAKATAPAKPPANAKANPPAEPAAASAEKSEDTAASDDDDIAAMLLSLHDDGSPTFSSSPEVPEGSTVHEMPLPPEVAAQMAKNEKEKEKEKPKSPGNTSSAAKSILEKYMKRPRT